MPREHNSPSHLSSKGGWGDRLNPWKVRSANEHSPQNEATRPPKDKDARRPRTPMRQISSLQRRRSESEREDEDNVSDRSDISDGSDASDARDGRQGSDISDTSVHYHPNQDFRSDRDAPNPPENGGGQNNELETRGVSGNASRGNASRGNASRGNASRENVEEGESSGWRSRGQSRSQSTSQSIRDRGRSRSKTDHSKKDRSQRSPRHSKHHSSKRKAKRTGIGHLDAHETFGIAALGFAAYAWAKHREEKKNNSIYGDHRNEGRKKGLALGGGLRR